MKLKKKHGKDNKQHEEQQQDENINLAPQEHKWALNGAYRLFRTPTLVKADVETYIERITPRMKTLIEQHIKELRSAKVQLHMWKKWKKKKTDELVDLPFNSKMTEIFQVSNLDEILEKCLPTSRPRQKTQQ